MSAKELILYQTQDGREPFTQWRKGLKDRVTVARIDRRLERVAEGHYGDFRPLDEGILELRLFFGPGYRIYFAEDGDKLIVLLCGGDKGSQKRDISAAIACWKEYLNSKDEAEAEEDRP